MALLQGQLRILGSLSLGLGVCMLIFSSYFLIPGCLERSQLHENNHLLNGWYHSKEKTEVESGIRVLGRIIGISTTALVIAILQIALSSFFTYNPKKFLSLWIVIEAFTALLSSLCFSGCVFSIRDHFKSMKHESLWFQFSIVCLVTTGINFSFLFLSLLFIGGTSNDNKSNTQVN